MCLNSFLISATISSIAPLASSLKCLDTNIFPTAAAKLPAADPTQVFHRGVVAILPVAFRAYSSTISRASLFMKPIEARAALHIM